MVTLLWLLPLWLHYYARTAHMVTLCRTILGFDYYSIIIGFAYMVTLLWLLPLWLHYYARTAHMVTLCRTILGFDYYSIIICFALAFFYFVLFVSSCVQENRTVFILRREISLPLGHTV